MPEPDFNGSDRFTYTVTDAAGLRSDPAVVALEVEPVNDTPTAADDGGSGFSTAEETGFITASVKGNDSDVDHPTGQLVVRVA